MNCPVTFDEAALAALRQSVSDRMSPKRFTHTAAVEDMVARLAALYCPEAESLLRAAALLHDITKELTPAQQIELCQRCSIILTPTDRLTPKTLHARTAAAIIPAEYPDFAQETVISAVRWHTTGRADMTLPEQLLYLADYIDDSRIFPDCVRLRTYFWDASPGSMSAEERQAHLRRTLIMSFDMTLRALVNEGALVSTHTTDARNQLILCDLTEGNNA